MPFQKFDRKMLKFKSLKERKNKIVIERDHVSVKNLTGFKFENVSQETANKIKEAAMSIKRAKKLGKSVILAFGAHTIKNGLSPVLIKLIEEGWVTHLATNGAGIIHDWEFAYLGESSEDVRENIKRGQFGIWEETGFYLNLAINIGSYEGLGYGESVGKMVFNDGLFIPERKTLIQKISKNNENWDATAMAADLLYLIDNFNLKTGYMIIKHPYKQYGLQAAAYRLNVPFTSHPMFGHDIIYTHPINHGASIGRTAERDFLTFVNSITGIDEGVYISLGSAVMSPMIFEKSLSMAQNIALQHGKSITKHKIFVIDLADYTWNWQENGEPPQDNPAYYLRYCKTFSRMGGTMTYIKSDNRDFLLLLYRELNS